MKVDFLSFREGVIGIDSCIQTPDGNTKPIIYADWTASGRCYLPIERRIQQDIMPFVGNTHTETSATGMAMTYAYHQAQKLIKKHVNAGKEDVLITATSGMTRLINKLQRILGLKLHSQYTVLPPEKLRPVVFITHMEHHSNHTSWLETYATVEIINPNHEGLVDVNDLHRLLQKYESRPLKIAAVTSCSNVTGISTPYHEIAKIMHSAGGYCFVDFACSAPYVHIDMHPSDEDAHLDAIYFSPHKFLGGPGSAGVLIFNSQLYNLKVPDHPGGGTVDWTNPWGEHKYIDDLEAREDGGTPAFLQTIKTAMCIQLKEQMGINNILEREHQLCNILWDKLASVPKLHILAPQHRKRLAIISFYIEDLHYNLAIRMLNDKFGIQARGGCSCAGTYGHFLLNVDRQHSQSITDRINHGDYSTKPGWIRISLHPTLTEEEVRFIGDGVAELAENYKEWSQKYNFEPSKNLLEYKNTELDHELKQQMDHALNDDFVSQSLDLSTLEREQ